MKDEREVLTKARIGEKLARDGKRAAVGAVLMLLLGAIVLGLLHLMLAVKNPPPSQWTVAAEIALDVLYFGACLFVLVRGVIRTVRAKRGAFTVKEDILVSVEEDKFSLKGFLMATRAFDRSNFVHVFHFLSGKKMVASSEEFRNSSVDTAARFSLPGDVFFLVFYDASPDKTVMIYSAKLYRYAENGDVSVK